MMRAHRLLALLVLAATTAFSPPWVPATAQDFYKGKTLSIVVGFSPGGGFDANARLLARYVGRYIPGSPDVIVNNMPGAASQTALRHLDAIAPKDGTVITTFNFGLIGASRITPDKVPVDFRKFAWIGSISEDLTVCFVWHALNEHSIADMKAGRKLNFGLTAIGASEDINTRILKYIFGVDITQISGYPGSAEEKLAIERGELDGGCGAWSSVPDEWIREKRIDVVYKTGRATPPDLPPNVPYLLDVTPDERSRAIASLLILPSQVGRPFVASQGVPADRIEILRKAFDNAVADPQFKADADKQRLPLQPRTGADAANVVEAIYASPEDIVGAARDVTSR
jgi:tripartite-type tricarboxylate transporter receptor subunit TctC